MHASAQKTRSQPRRSHGARNAVFNIWERCTYAYTCCQADLCSLSACVWVRASHAAHKVSEFVYTSDQMALYKKLVDGKERVMGN